MHDQRDLTQDAVLRAQIAMANGLIAQQSAAIAKAHLAIGRAIERLREPDGESRRLPLCSLMCQIAPNPNPRFASKNDPSDGAETGGAEPQIAEQSRSWRAAIGERETTRGS
jgi:hypothetical protein